MKEALKEACLRDRTHGDEVHPGKLPALLGDQGFSHLLSHGNRSDERIGKLVGKGGLRASVLDRDDAGLCGDDSEQVFGPLPDGEVLDPIPFTKEPNVVKILEPIVDQVERDLFPVALTARPQNDGDQSPVLLLGSGDDMEASLLQPTGLETVHP